MSDNSSSWAPAFIVGALIAAYIGFSDVRFSIPEHKPIKQKSVLLSDGVKRYFIIYDEDFVGSAIFWPDQMRVDFEIRNTSRDPETFEGAKYTLWTTKHVGYGLEMAGVENASWENGSLIFNPKDGVRITTLAPTQLPALGEVEGFSIRLKDGLVPRKIRFGYERAGWWNRLRWWIAGQIRKD